MKMLLHKMKLCRLVMVLIFCSFRVNAQQGENEVSRSVAKVIQRLLQKTTNKMTRPYPSGKDPLIVKTDIKLMSVGNFREADMHFTVEMYLRQTWHDPRLAYSPNETDVPSITLNGNLADSFWQPDTFIENEVEGKLHDLLAKNKFFRIHQDGRILMSNRLTVACSCIMNFKRFPMDRQECGIFIGSFGYITRDIVYEWQEKHETLSRQYDIPQFILKNITMTKVTRAYLTGDYSFLEIKMLFVRRLGHYITRVYIPAMLIVMLSWLSFFIDRRSAPARVSLGITTVLTMTTLLIGIGQGSMPAVAYVKALDWYLFVSYFMVFAAFGEYAVMNYREAKYQLSKTKPLQQNGTVPSQKETPAMGSASDVYSNMAAPDGVDCLQEAVAHLPQPAKRKNCFIDWFTLKFLVPPEKIDSWAKILFPSAYLVFNVVYWSYYLLFADI